MPGQPVQSRAVRTYIADVISRALRSSGASEDSVMPFLSQDREEQNVSAPASALRVLEGSLLADELVSHSDAGALDNSCNDSDVEDDLVVFEEGSFSADDDAYREQKHASALRVLESALLSDEFARHNDAGALHNSCSNSADDGTQYDVEDDIAALFEEGSYSADADAFMTTENIQHAPLEFPTRTCSFSDRVHVRVADAMGAARNGMSYLGCRWEAFSYGLDDAAEKYTHQLEHIEGFVKVKMSTISGKTHSTYKVLVPKAAKCKQRIELGADLVSGKARILSQAARLKAGGLTSSKLATKGRKGLHAARDKMHATLANQTRFAWQSWKSSKSKGGA
eukprot:CAMPEP_0169085678 /NCGR_PEP_ID=MMETSP1015-20121227/13293_1 /TAXON_ID=342587 /ORGANISM="Karlodinium micrum, Strain CCMP2283" /LENGTH=337 /DNA_ID=CAMNT_0009145791 /DNA_START=52 /DNA_END=1065 /DNA_ORIENTATION=-